MLDPSKEHVEKVCISLLREYLIKRVREFQETLETFNKESAPLIPILGFYGSRQALAHDLGMEGLMKINKHSESPFKSLLEVLVKCFLEDREYLRKAHFADSCVHSHGDEKKETIIREKGQKGGIIGSHSTTTYNHTQESQQSGINQEAYVQHQMKNTASKEKSFMHGLVPAIDNPMAIFCQKLLESKILSNNSRGIMSLEQSQDGEEYEGAGGNDAWIPEEPKSTSITAMTSLDKASSSSSLKLNERGTSGSDTKRHMKLGSNLLESKQNLLAQVCLSPEENEIRQQAQLDPDMSSEPSISLNQSRTSKSSTTEGFKIRNVDSLTESDMSGKSGSKCSPFFEKVDIQPSRSSPSSVTKILDSETWAGLKGIVLGERGVLQEGWIGQGFNFSQNIPYGLVQKKGGPCGVLTVVEALLLRNLMFGSAFCDPTELPLEAFDPTSFSLASNYTHLRNKRSDALIGTLNEILWRCGSHSKPGSQHSVTVGFPGGNGYFGPGTEIRIFYDLDDLRVFVEANLYRFDCIGLVYSVVLTRGIQNVQDDMDFQNSPLLGQHGYCTQELLNLLTMGKATSNAFDNELLLGEKLLKGISSQADIGFLSLFEHYNSCSVGSFLKNPKFPLWIVCSESHFSLLFSPDMRLTRLSCSGSGNEKDEEKEGSFDLFYYDGLARQEHIIRLTLSFDSPGAVPVSAKNLCPSNNNNIRAYPVDEDLVPPLEKCIRTKWTGVNVDWNETEPIL